MSTTPSALMQIGENNDCESEHPSSLPQGATSSTPILTNNAPLSQDEQERLQKYLKLLQTVRKGGQNRGSAHDLLDLLARASSMNKATTRAATLAFQEVDTNPHIHRRLRNLRTVDEEQRVRRKTMQAELEVLRKNTMIFGQYKPEVFGRLEEESANESISQIIKFCPTLFQLLFGLCQNSEETTPQTQNYARIAMIVSIICFSRHPRLSNCLQVFLTLLLHSSGAKRHVFALTQSFGFTESYDSVMSTVRGLRSKALDAIADRFQATPHAIAYDNCDVYLGVSEQGNKKGENYSITSGLMYPIQGVPLPDGGIRRLLQSDFDHEFKLEMGDIVPTKHEETLIDDIKTQQIILALEGVFPDLIARCKTNKRFQALSLIPVVSRLPIPPLDDARKPTPMMPVMIDESTTQNNIEILREFFREQLRLSDDVFDVSAAKAPAFLVAGDNKTLNRIWSAVDGAAGNLSKYDKLRHLVAVPGLFHGLMHVVTAITMLYWGAELEKGERISHATLRYSAGKLDRRFVGPNNLIYTHGKTFLTDNYHARLLAEFYGHTFTSHKYQSRTLDRHSPIDSIKALVNSLSATEVTHLVKKTAASLCSPEDCTEDAERAITLAFVRDFNAFVTFHNGIKYGDIGLLKASLPNLIELFAQTKKRQYVQEFLYLERLLSTEYVKPEAQLAVASALFVNPTGRADGWFAADLACEFVNRYIKDQWSHRRKSTLSVRELSEFCTLNAIFFHPLREHLNKTWGRTIRPRHTSAARGAVIGRLASYLLKTVTYDGSRSSITVPGVNITRDYACKILIKQLMSFNIKFLQSARGDGEDIDDEEKEEEIQISLEIPMLYDQEQGYDEGADEEAEDMADFIDQWAAMDEE